jgi:hypothetical protein
MLLGAPHFKASRSHELVACQRDLNIRTCTTPGRLAKTDISFLRSHVEVARNILRRLTCSSSAIRFKANFFFAPVALSPWERRRSWRSLRPPLSFGQPPRAAVDEGNMRRPIRSRDELVTWIESCVLGDLRTVLVGVDAYYASPSQMSTDRRPLGSANCLLVASSIDSCLTTHSRFPTISEVSST